MSRRRTGDDRPGQVGRYWLTRRAGSPFWQRTWYDKRTGRTRRVSLGETDFDAARFKLTQWWLETHRPQRRPPESTLIDRVMAIHYEDHARHLASAEQARIALAYWQDYFEGRTVADLTPARQRLFVDWLRAKGHSDGYISRTLAVGRTALNTAVKHQQLVSAPFIFDVLTTREKRSRQPKGRPLTLEEMGRLFDAAEPQHLRTFLLVVLNTLTRTDAALDLKTDQIDWEYKLVRLNPEGRPQTKKYRPIVPLTETLAFALAAPWRPFGAVVFVKYDEDGDGVPVKSIRTAWDHLRETAKLDDRVNPYSIRHTMARHLRSRRVDPTEISLMLGHVPTEGSQTSQIYAPFSPTYCRHAAREIDRYCQRLQKHVGWQIAPKRKRRKS